MKTIRRASIIAWMNLKRICRSKLSLLTTLLLPGVMLLTFLALSGGKLTLNPFLGALIFVMTMMGVAGSAQGLAEDLEGGFMKFYRVSPVSPLSYALGTSFVYLSIGLILSGLFLVLGVLSDVIQFSSIPIMVLALIIIGYCCASMGFVIGSYINEASQVSRISSLLVLALVLLPPVYYSPEVIAAPWSALARIIPTALAAEFLRSVAGAGSMSPFLPLVGLLGFGLLFTILTVKKARWRMK